jgi:hypothetical protein
MTTFKWLRFLWWGVRTILQHEPCLLLSVAISFIVPIASFPTTETGLSRFRLHLRKPTECSTWSLWSHCLEWWYSCHYEWLLYAYAENVCSRKFFWLTAGCWVSHRKWPSSYGNVIYPLDEHSRICSELPLKQWRWSIPSGKQNSSCTLDIIAPPNSISTRQAVSVTVHTELTHLEFTTRNLAAWFRVE